MRRETILLGMSLAWAALSVSAWLGGCGSDRTQKRPAETTVRCGDAVWRVRLAMTPSTQRRGLGGVSELAEDEGMLFAFPVEKPRHFWMKDCLIPLDIAFLNADRKVVAIHTMPVHTGDGPLPWYDSGDPAIYALEVPAGALERAGVRVGDEFTFSPAVEQAIARARRLQ